ncbi:unnamed protein product, partial [Chrysoparadoxa australica]
DPRNQLIAELARTELLVRPFSGYIFLCGGPIDVRASQPVSIRDALLRRLHENPNISDSVKIAEDFQEWGFDGIYTDLLTFETHLAELASVIVVILESEGSLAELGLFSAIDGVKHKIQVFIDEVHYESESFIRLGPIKYMEDALENQAEVESWLVKRESGWKYDQGKAASVSRDITSAVQHRLDQSKSREEDFNSEKWLHRVLLACDVISFAGALTLSEISKYLKNFNIEFSQKELKQALLTAKLVGLVKSKAKGTQRYYISMTPKMFIKFRGLDQRVDIDRSKLNILNYYRDNDRKRYFALRSERSE